jgi:oxalate decarboxylase
MSDLSFQNNVPDPLLAVKELPTFKFKLEKSKGKVLGNSFGKEATVEQLPISKGIAGVSMQLEPGVMPSFTGTLPPLNGRSFSKAAFAQQ